jgi:hypothetical protein
MKPLDPARFERAVICLALNTAKYRVLDQIFADGLKLSQFTCREINDKRHAYFAANMEELITKAIEDAWKLSTFARHRPQPQPQG